MFEMMLAGLGETLYMVLFSTFLAYILGLPMGVALVLTDTSGITPRPLFHRVLGAIINLVRSAPFIILLIAVIPFTRFVVGTTLGPTAVVVPLVIGSAPFIARLVESSIQEVDRGVIEAAQSMGASPKDIVLKVMLPEARPSLIVGSTIAITTILGYSAMSGFVGGGGLGDIAIRYGYNRYQTDIMFITLIILVILVQIFQEAGMKIAKKIDKRI